MAARASVVRFRQLSAAIWQVRHPDLLRRLFHDVVEAAPRHGRDVFAIWIAGPILNRARHPHVALGFGKPRRNFGVIDRPILSEPIQTGRFEVDITKTGRGAAPEIGLTTSALTSLPIPIGTRSIGVNHIMLPQMRAVIK